jgi:hypothetical protein
LRRALASITDWNMAPKMAGLIAAQFSPQQSSSACRMALSNWAMGSGSANTAPFT